MAIGCWGYHEQRSAMGIPEPSKLDPVCGAAGLAACIHELNGAYDKKPCWAHAGLRAKAA